MNIQGLPAAFWAKNDITFVYMKYNLYLCTIKGKCFQT